MNTNSEGETRFVNSLEQVAEHFGVSRSVVTRWRDEDQCRLLQKAPYDLHGVRTWLDITASNSIDGHPQQKTVAEIENINKKNRIFSFDKNFILSGAAVGVALYSETQRRGDNDSLKQKSKIENLQSALEFNDRLHNYHFFLSQTLDYFDIARNLLLGSALTPLSDYPDIDAAIESFKDIRTLASQTLAHFNNDFSRVFSNYEAPLLHQEEIDYRYGILGAAMDSMQKDELERFRDSCIKLHDGISKYQYAISTSEESILYYLRYRNDTYDLRPRLIEVGNAVAVCITSGMRAQLSHTAILARFNAAMAVYARKL